MGKKRVVAAKGKSLTITAPTSKSRRVRLAIECSAEERKIIKMFAAHEEKTINDFVLDCVWEKTHGCSHSHIPNKETADALDASERGEGHRAHASIEDMFKFLGM